MFIDMHVHPAFYEPINQDSELEELRHNTLDIHKNGTAPLEHIFNQMKCAGLDYLCLLPEDYRTQQGGKVLVSNEEISQLVKCKTGKYYIDRGQCGRQSLCGTVFDGTGPR